MFDGDPEYLKAATEAGFSESQAAFLWDTFALDPHTHTADQVYMDDDEEQSLDEYLEGLA